MCRKSLRLPKQQGFLMPMAIFILLALAGLGIAISRLSSASFGSSVQEATLAQSLYAAESGAQYAMHKLLFNESDNAQVDANCNNLNGSSLAFNAVGLASCNVTITCVSVANNDAGSNIYDLQSAARCGGGELYAERTIAVRAVYE